MTGKKSDRDERLAKALRENLKRRKAHAHGMDASAPAKAGAKSGEADKR